MRIEKLHVRNLRAAKDLVVSFDSMNALVGANGSGKSTILLALRVLFGKAPLTDEDYHNVNTKEDIIITAMFGGLGPSARDAFSGYVGPGGTLEITCIVHWDGSRAVRTLHGTAPQNPDFAPVRSETRDAMAKPLYESLAGRPEYAGLPLPWPGIERALRALAEWEGRHPDRCTPMLDSGRFFGPAGPGLARLSGLVRFLYVPAAAPDAAEGGAAGAADTVLDELLGITIQRAIAEKKEYKALPGKLRKACEETMDHSRPPEITWLVDALNSTLGSLVPDTQVEIVGEPPELSIGKPRFSVCLNENRYPSPVAGAGHGLQRALILAALHHISRAQADGESYADATYRHPARSAKARAATSRYLGGADDARDAPTAILAIEEPELYQHPTRMRHLARLLRSLPGKGLAGVPGPVQVLYTTHSPHFVFADRAGQIRLVRMRHGRSVDPGVTTVASATQSDILEDMRRCGMAGPARAMPDHLLARAMGPALSEGFFSTVVVLVEGQSDRIVLEGVAEAMEAPLDSLGVSVIPCESKSAMPLPIALFRRFGIPVYAVWDADRGGSRQDRESRRIASALGCAGSEWRGRICGTFACLNGDLEGTVHSDLNRALGPPGTSGPHHERILQKRYALHGMHRGGSKILDARLLMEEVGERRIRLETIELIVRQIAELAEGEAGGTLI